MEKSKSLTGLRTIGLLQILKIKKPDLIATILFLDSINYLIFQVSHLQNITLNYCHLKLELNYFPFKWHCIMKCKLVQLL